MIKVKIINGLKITVLSPEAYREFRKAQGAERAKYLSEKDVIEIKKPERGIPRRSER